MGRVKWTNKTCAGTQRSATVGSCWPLRTKGQKGGKWNDMTQDSRHLGRVWWKRSDGGISLFSDEEWGRKEGLLCLWPPNLWSATNHCHASPGHLLREPGQRGLQGGNRQQQMWVNEWTGTAVQTENHQHPLRPSRIVQERIPYQSRLVAPGTCSMLSEFGLWSDSPTLTWAFPIRPEKGKQNTEESCCFR